MKAKLNKLLRKYQGHWCSPGEQIVGILPQCLTEVHYAPLVWGESKGFLSSKLEGKYQTFYFTEKGEREILQKLKETTCITGRVVR